MFASRKVLITGTQVCRIKNTAMLTRLHRVQKGMSQYIRPLHRSSTLYNNQTTKYKYGLTVKQASPQEDSMTPVVVILGWNSSKQKHLAKYCEMFEKKKYNTISITSNPFNTFFRSGSKVKEISHYILNSLVEIKSPDQPVLLYAFSNGGCALYFHILEALTTPDTRHYNSCRIAGTIFDSCPVDPYSEFAIRNVQESVSDVFKNPLVRSFLWFSLGLITPLVRFNAAVKRFMPVLVNSPLKSPQLVLYSKTDKLAPYEDIDKYVEARKQKGFDITAKRWDESQHVNHFREHNQEYVKLLDDFIDHCLRKQQSDLKK